MNNSNAPAKQRAVKLREAAASRRDCYIGRKDCGCLVAVVFDDPKYRNDTAKTVADFVKHGYRVESAVWDEVRDQLKRCKCEHEQI